ncbi:hypothetical protein CVT24_010429 [Panaeolus cyanescens]|uniref:Uncharacterized protein n=1 Tax=Panaeolus cyanescens TaxID=181874 RepID=A0A409YPP3_9AGAR|nr:hypothetical protein CVT24_010429 [Panaeolus cyanescens]
MKFIRRKSDAKRGHLSSQSTSSNLSIPNYHHQDTETSQSGLSSSNNFLDSLPELPPTNDFRTSLILPESTAGEQATFDQLRTKLANQRAQGAEHQIPEEVEDMLLETLGRFRSRSGNTPDRSSENVHSEAGAGVSNPSSSPPRSTKRYSNNLFGSGSMKNYSYINRVGTSSRGSTASSSRTASLTPTEASVAAAARARVSSSGSTQDGNGSKTSLTNSSPNNSTSNINFIPSTSSTTANGTHTPPPMDSFNTPYAISEEGPLLHIYAAEQRLQKALGPTGLKRVSLALGAVIKEIEDEAEDEVLVPRSSPSVPTSGGHLDSPTANGVGLAVSASSDNRDSNTSMINDSSSSYPSLPAHIPSSSFGGPSNSSPEEPMAISGDVATAQEILERRASPIPARSVLGYVPGMPRPMTPRDFEYDEVRSHSTTPRAQSPYGELPSGPSSPTFGGFGNPGPSTPTNKHQRRSSTSSGARGSPSVLSSAAPLFLQRSTNTGRHTPVSSISTWDDATGDSAENRAANRSPSPTSTTFSSSILNSRRRPASPLAGPSFQPLATAATAGSNTSPYRISGSRPSTPSNVIWQPSASVSTSGHTFSPPPTQPQERPHSRNNSWSTSTDGGITPSSDIQMSLERYGMLSSSSSSNGSALPTSTNKTIARILGDPALPDSPLEEEDETGSDRLMAALGLGGSASEGNGSALPSSFLLDRKLATPSGNGWNSSSAIHAPSPSVRSATPTQNARSSNTSPAAHAAELMQQRNAAGSRRSMRGGSISNSVGNGTPVIGSNGNGSPARYGASTPSLQASSTWGHANNMSTSTTSSFGNSLLDGRPNGAFSSLGFAPRANSSRSSLDSAGSSYHSWEDGEGGGNIAVDRVFSVFTAAANSLEEGKVPTGATPTAWHNFSESVNGFTPSPPLNSLKDEPENDPEEVMRRFAGLSKEDFVNLQVRLVAAEYTRIANIDPRDRAPSVMRRRRPSTSQSNYGRVNSPIPQPPASPTQPLMDEHHALLNAMVDSIKDRPSAVSMSASGNISSSSDELSPTSRRNRDLAQVLFGSEDNEDDQGGFTPKVRGEFLFQPDNTSTQLPDDQSGNKSAADVFANQATPTPSQPSLPSLSASVSSNLTSASNTSNSQGSTQPGISTPLSSFSNAFASPSQNSPYLLARNPSTHRVPQTAQEEAELVREVKQKADAAMLALNKNPSTTNVTDVGLKHTTSIRRRVDPSQISTPKLVSATTSVDTIPLKSPSLAGQNQASASQHDIGGSKLGSRFKLRLRGSLRAKPVISSGEETVTEAKSPGPSQVAYYDSSKLNPGTPTLSSATEAGRFKVPVPTPPASAGPGLRGFMARFRNKQRMSESQTPSSGERPLQSIGTPATPISPSTPRAMQSDTPASPRAAATPTESRAHTPTPRPPGQPRPIYSRFPPANPPLSPGPSSAPSATASVSNSSNTAPSSQATQVQRPTTPAESLDASQSAAALEQLFAAAQNLGLDHNALSDLLARSGSTSSRQLLSKNPSAVASASGNGNAGTSRSANATSSSQSKSEGPGSLSYVGSTGSDKTATPTQFGDEQASRSYTGRPITPDELSRKTSVRKNDTLRRPPKESAQLDVVNTVVRRTIIFANDVNLADLGAIPQRKTSMRKKRASTQSTKSVVDRAPTPPPPKSTGKRFSADGLPPMPNQVFQSLGQVDGMLNVPSTSTGLPIEKSNSTYDSLYDMYAGESRVASMAAHDLNLPADQQLGPSETGGPAVELLEMANGQVIWNIVNGLRDGDDESIYTGRTSFESEYSTREPGPDNLQVFVKEHTRSGSKGSITSSFVSKKKTVQGKTRPETKIMYSSSAQLGRLIENLSHGMDAGSFNFQPQSRPPSRPYHSASSSLSTNDPNLPIEDKITRMLNAMNMS